MRHKDGRGIEIAGAGWCEEAVRDRISEMLKANK